MKVKILSTIDTAKGKLEVGQVIGAKPKTANAWIHAKVAEAMKWLNTESVYYEYIKDEVLSECIRKNALKFEKL